MPLPLIALALLGTGTLLHQLAQGRINARNEAKMKAIEEELKKRGINIKKELEKRGIKD